jgi:hypothetical protein
MKKERHLGQTDTRQYLRKDSAGPDLYLVKLGMGASANLLP